MKVSLPNFVLVTQNRMSPKANALHEGASLPSQIRQLDVPRHRRRIARSRRRGSV
jgi:hypothetical protein